MARIIPPLPDPNIPMFSGPNMMETWRVFWTNLLLYLGGVPNGSNLAGSTIYANDAAAAAGGVQIGQFYRTSATSINVRST